MGAAVSAHSLARLACAPQPAPPSVIGRASNKLTLAQATQPRHDMPVALLRSFEVSACYSSR